MQSLTTSDQFDVLLDAAAPPLTIVYKHSTRCPISVLAAEEVARFEEAHPGVPVYLVDVVADRAVARHVADRLEVTHHSPQAIVLARGRVVWHGSHFDVRAETLAERVGVLAER